MNKVIDYVIAHWVSWVIEIIVIGIVGYFTISEVRKTNELTRTMLIKYDQAVSQYASDKTKVIDENAAAGTEYVKESVMNFMKKKD